MKMKFESKISGTKVTDFGEIKTIFSMSGFVSLEECMALDLKQETMNYILDELRFHRGERTSENEGMCIWWTTMDCDTIMKLTILEKDEYSEQRKELIDYFGENWLHHYIRFGH